MGGMELRWLIDDALNFTPHLAVLGLAVVAYAIFGRHWPLAVLSLLLVVVAVGYVARSDALLVRAHECGPGARLKVATFNVAKGDADLEAIARFVEAENVDIVVLQELTAFPTGEAERLLERYPYRTFSNPRWLAIFSTTPFGSVEAFSVFMQSEARQVWRATVVEPFPADLYFLHGMKPDSALHHEMRSTQFARIEDLVGDASTATIVAGDFHATVLDPTFAGMLRRTGLRSAVDGRRDSPTWPAAIGPLGIRIDHVLERGFEVCAVERGPSFGSDHRVLIVELAESTAS